MEKIGLNLSNTAYNLPVNNKKQEVFSCENYSCGNGVYPVYTQLPYGINRKNYVKIAENKLPTGETVHTYKLINGQTVSIVQKAEGCPIVTTAFQVGALDEPEGKEGISHLIEHSIFHESSKYDDVDKCIKELGGYSNAATGYNITKYYIKLSNNDKATLEKALDIEADMLFNPKFSKVDSKEKKIVVKEAKEYEADEGVVLDNQGIKNLFLINKPGIKDVLTGNEKSINSITLEDMFNYHREFYIPSNCATTIITPLNPDEVIEVASKKFLEASKNTVNHKIQRKNYNCSNAITRSDLISKTETKKSINFGFAAPIDTPQNKIKLIALCELIKNRSSFNYRFKEIHGNNFYINITDDKNNEYDSFEAIKECLNNISKNPIEDSELQKIKNILSDSIKSKYLNNEDVSTNISKENLSGKFEYSIFENAVKNLTKDDILSMLPVLDINKCSMQVYHPKDTTKKELDEALEKYKNYVRPISIPGQIQNIDIKNNMENYNIYPYSSSPVKSAVLPDNTRFIALDNSKSDDCTIKWELYNPNLSSYNPAARLLIGFFQGNRSQEDELSGTQKNFNIDDDFVNPNKYVLTVNCKTDTLEEAIKQLKKEMNKNFSEYDFKSNKETLKDVIKNLPQDTSYERFIRDKFGENFESDKDKLLEYLEKLTLNDVKRYYNELIQNSYSTACAKIPYGKDKELINKTASLINVPNFSFKKEDDDKFEKKYSSQNVQKLYIKEANQPEYGMIYNYKISGNEQDRVKFDILNSVLTDRIFENIREKQHLAYRAGSDIENRGDTGIISLYTVTDHKDKETIEKIYSQFKDEIKKITETPISKDELEKAKNDLKMTIFDISENDTDTLSCMLSSAKAKNGIYQKQNTLNYINSVTAEDLLQTAQYVFKNNPDYLIEADKDTLENNKDYFNTLSKRVVS